MSISVRCDECGKTYQVPEAKAGRRGRCPKGHSIRVPVPAAAAVEENAFAFTAEPVAGGTPKSSRRRPVHSQPEPAPEVDETDFSAFPTHVAGGSSRDEDNPAPTTSRHRRPPAKEGKPSLVPLILGGILAVLGIGGGVTLLVVSRGEVGPLKEATEAANKKAAEAEERAQKADALRVLAEANLEAARKNPPRDPALAEAQKTAKAAEKRADAAEKQLKGFQATGGAAARDLDPNGPGGKNDPVMPGGKLELDRAAKAKEMEKKEMDKPGAKTEAPANPPADNADGPPLGGKNWSAPGGAKFGDKLLKGGDRLWLYPVEDAAPKAVNGKLTVKFRWRLRKGKQMPKGVGVGLMVQEAKGTRMVAYSKALTGESGEAEATFDVKDFKGGLPVYFFIGNGDAKKPVAYSTMLGFQVDFGPAK
jgi:hypothetical protein